MFVFVVLIIGNLNVVSLILYQCFYLRSSLSQMFYKIRILKRFAKFTGKHLCYSLFSIKSQTSGLATLIIRLQQRFLLEKFSKSLRAHLLQITSAYRMLERSKIDERRKAAKK